MLGATYHLVNTLLVSTYLCWPVSFCFSFCPMCWVGLLFLPITFFFSYCFLHPIIFPSWPLMEHTSSDCAFSIAWALFFLAFWKRICIETPIPHNKRTTKQGNNTSRMPLCLFLMRLACASFECLFHISFWFISLLPCLFG